MWVVSNRLKKEVACMTSLRHSPGLSLGMPMPFFSFVSRALPGPSSTPANVALDQRTFSLPYTCPSGPPPPTLIPPLLQMAQRQLGRCTVITPFTAYRKYSHRSTCLEVTGVRGALVGRLYVVFLSPFLVFAEDLILKIKMR